MGHVLKVVLLFILVKGSASLRCLSCYGVVSPIHCHRVRTCDAGDICFTEEYENMNGEILYNVGCHSPTVCKKRNHVTDQGVIDPGRKSRCTDCCEADICNSAGCAARGYPTDRGPICFSCGQTRDPELCTYIDGCDKHEVCYVQEVSDFGETVYTMSCRPTNACHNKGHVGMGQIIGRRSLTECSYCCNGDLCNHNCTGVGDPITKPTIDVRTTTTQMTTTQMMIQRSCKEVASIKNVTGIYTVAPVPGSPVNVTCMAGGWTVIQQRNNGSVDFYRTWQEYKNGFGTPSTEYWIGNDAIHALTSSGTCELRIEMVDTNGKSLYANYRNFSIEDEAHKYVLHLSGFSGNTANHLAGAHNGQKFSTKDQDNDNFSGNCGQLKHAGYWFNGCNASNLNGNYKDPTCCEGFYWDSETMLKRSIMMIRCS